MFKLIIQDFREYYSHLSEFLFLIRFNFKMKFYSKLADFSCMASGLKTRVVITGTDRKMEVWNKRTAQRYQKPVKMIGKKIQPDGSSKNVTKFVPGRIPRNWGNIELNKVTFYIARSKDDQYVSPEEREEYRIKFNQYAKTFMRKM
jgi:hypothetical protein